MAKGERLADIGGLRAAGGDPFAACGAVMRRVADSREMNDEIVSTLRGYVRRSRSESRSLPVYLVVPAGVDAYGIGDWVGRRIPFGVRVLPWRDAADELWSLSPAFDGRRVASRAQSVTAAREALARVTGREPSDGAVRSAGQFLDAAPVPEDAMPALAAAGGTACKVASGLIAAYEDALSARSLVSVARMTRLMGPVLPSMPHMRIVSESPAEHDLAQAAFYASAVSAGADVTVLRRDASANDLAAEAEAAGAVFAVCHGTHAMPRFIADACRLLHDRGTDWSDMAVSLADVSDAYPDLLDALASSGVPFECRLSLPVSRHPAGGTVLSLLRGAAPGEEPSSLADGLREAISGLDEMQDDELSEDAMLIAGCVARVAGRIGTGDADALADAVSACRLPLTRAYGENGVAVVTQHAAAYSGRHGFVVCGMESGASRRYERPDAFHAAEEALGMTVDRWVGASISRFEVSDMLRIAARSGGGIVLARCATDEEGRGVPPSVEWARCAARELGDDGLPVGLADDRRMLASELSYLRKDDPGRPVTVGRRGGAPDASLAASVMALRGKNVFAPTEIERYLMCPRSWLMSSSALGYDDEATDDPRDFRNIGSMVHDALRRYHVANADLHAPDEGLMRASVDAAVAARGVDGASADLVRAHVLRRVRRSVCADVSLPDGCSVLSNERGVGNRQILGEGSSFRIGGRIDRIDAVGEPHDGLLPVVVVDYKGAVDATYQYGDCLPPHMQAMLYGALIDGQPVTEPGHRGLAYDVLGCVYRSYSGGSSYGVCCAPGYLSARATTDLPTVKSALAEAREAAVSAVEGMMSGAFERRPSDEACRRCPTRPACEIGRQ